MKTCPLDAYRSSLVCWIIGEPDSAGSMGEIVSVMALFHAGVLYEIAGPVVPGSIS
jgi:hypothetical protein